VNILCSGHLIANVEDYPVLHDMLLQLAAKEPGGLRARGKDGAAFAVGASAVPAPKGRQTTRQLSEAPGIVET
jgi:hypothetical protein